MFYATITSVASISSIYAYINFQNAIHPEADSGNEKFLYRRASLAVKKLKEALYTCKVSYGLALVILR